jgi:hypothetical protein
MYYDEVVEAFEEVINLTHDDIEIMGETFSALYILESNSYSFNMAFDRWVRDNYTSEYDRDLGEVIYTPI